jgi:hypothetical protein
VADPMSRDGHPRGPKDALELHGRPCPVCTDGRVRVEFVGDAPMVGCDRCGSTGRTICQRAGVPWSVITAACERWAR